MRLLGCLMVLGLMVMLTLLSGDAVAAPQCSQIDSDFCYPCPPGTATIEFRGSCANEDREWRCYWTCQGGIYSAWIPCNCPSQGGGCDCLLAGTPITLADGTTKPVESIQVGDEVLSLDEATGEMKAAKVVVVHRPFVTDRYYVINGALRVTETHPFLSNGRWVGANNLKVGDVVRGDGSSSTIYSIRLVEEEALAYNFQVATGTYLAAGMIVHNKEICEHFMQYPN